MTALAVHSITVADSVGRRRRRRWRARRRLRRPVGVLVVAFCVSISVGDFTVPLERRGRRRSSASAARTPTFIVRTLRLPRALTGVLVGVAFGLSGAIFQSTRPQPAGQPGHHRHRRRRRRRRRVLHRRARHDRRRSPPAARSVARSSPRSPSTCWPGSSGVSPYRLVLVGIGVAAVLTAVTQYLLTRAEIFEAQRAVVWLTGSLNGRGWDDVRTGARRRCRAGPGARPARRIAAHHAARRRRGEGPRRPRRARSPAARARRRRVRRAGDRRGRADHLRRLRRRARSPAA